MPNASDHKATPGKSRVKNRTIKSQSKRVLKLQTRYVEDQGAKIDIYALPPASPPHKRQKVSGKILQSSSIKTLKKESTPKESGLIRPASAQPIPSSRKVTAAATFQLHSRQTLTPQLAQPSLCKIPIIAWDKTGPKNQGTLRTNFAKFISKTEIPLKQAPVESPALKAGSHVQNKTDVSAIAGSQTIIDENGSPIPSQDQDLAKAPPQRYCRPVSQSFNSNSKAKPISFPSLGSPIFFKAQDITNGSSRQETYLAGEKSLVNQQCCLGDPFKRSTSHIRPTLLLEKLKAGTADQNGDNVNKMLAANLEILESPHLYVSSSTSTTVPSPASQIDQPFATNGSDEWPTLIQAHRKIILETLSLIAQVLLQSQFQDHHLSKQAQVQYLITKEQALYNVKNEYRKGVLHTLSQLEQNRRHDHTQFEQGFSSTQKGMMTKYERSISRVKENFQYRRANATTLLRQNMRARHTLASEAIDSAIRDRAA